jgi:hypothetical protein
MGRSAGTIGSLSPEGTIVNSQGRKPLWQRDRQGTVNAEGVAEVLPPFQG